jgi:RNA polymerase sigma-70 factor (ECF subfamily)
MDEIAVIGLVRDGTADAFSAIIDHYQEPIFRYLYRLTGEYQLAQDLAQDTFVKAYEEILKTRDELNLKAWLYKIATNNAYKHFRRAKLISFLPLDDGRAHSLTENGEPDNTTEQLAIREAIKSVPLEMRNCLVLHLVEGFKYREIAETLGISEDAVRMRVSRGKEAFRKCYDGRKNQ